MFRPDFVDGIDRNNGRVKTIYNNDLKVVTIICDLIVHSRGEIVEKDNLIALEMKKCDEVLNNIPLYVEYNGVLEALNSITSMITDGLNEEFQKLLNKKEGINNE